MGSPKASVIMPAYNVAPYIGQAIESVQAQTLADWELIIVDDASTDDTAEVVKRYLGDSRIKFFQNEQNMGAGYTRNRALDAATGEWIAVLDADDWYAPHRLERLIAFAEEWGADVVGDLIVKSYPHGESRLGGWATFGRIPERPQWISVDQAIRDHAAFQHVALAEFIRTRGIRYAEHIRKSQDYAFLMEMFLKGARVAILPEPMYHYRIHYSYVTGRYRRDVSQIRASCEYLCSLPRVSPRHKRLLWQSFVRRRTLMLYPVFVEALRARSWEEARRLIREEPRILMLLLKRLPRAVYHRLKGTPRYDPRSPNEPT